MFEDDGEIMSLISTVVHDAERKKVYYHGEYLACQKYLLVDYGDRTCISVAAGLPQFMIANITIYS